MALTGPFASLPNISFAVKDIATIQSSVITGFEAAWLAGTGEQITLAPGDPRTLFLLNIADLISAQRSVIDVAAKQDLLAYATGAFLDHIGTYYGPDGLRLTQSAAVTTLQFTLASVAGVDVTVPAGTQASVGNIVFQTSTDVTIPAGSLTGTVSAMCLTFGTIGNGYVAGQVTNLLNFTSAFTLTVTNTNTTSGGSDAEVDAAYASRLYTVPAALSKSGPRLSYQKLAFAANPTITDVAVCSVDDGFPAGEVHIFAIGQGGATLTSAVLAEILANCSAEDERPVADHVFAAAPTAVPFTVSVQYWIDNDNSANETAIQLAVTAAVNTWIANITDKIGRSINGSQLISAMIRAGASRVVIVSPTDAVLLRYQIGVLSGTPTITFEGLESDNWS